MTGAVPGVLLDQALVGHGHSYQLDTAERTSSVLVQLQSGASLVMLILTPEMAEQMAESLTTQARITRQHRDDGVPLAGPPGEACPCAGVDLSDVYDAREDADDRCTCGHPDCGAC